MLFRSLSPSRWRSPAAADAHATARVSASPAANGYPGAPPAFISPHSSSLNPFRTRTSSNHGESSSPLRPQAPPRRQLVPVYLEHPWPRCSHQCASWSLEPPPVRRNRHQVAAWTFFPNSGRRRDFCLYFFYSEPRLNSSRCKHPHTPLNHPVALTRARLLSSDLSTVSSCASPRGIVAGPFQPSSDLSDFSSELLDPLVCSPAPWFASNSPELDTPFLPPPRQFSAASPPPANPVAPGRAGGFLVPHCS